MNRSASLLFALGVLVAHALVLVQDAFGHLARPADEVHVAFRMARNLVREGTAAFDPSGPLVEGYPSPAWVLLAALAERLYLGPNQVAQAVGLASALGLVWVVSRFSPARLAGVMAPLFVVVSGSVATAALAGTEWATFALLCALGLLLLEEGRPRALALVTSLAVLVRPEGLLLVLALGALALASRARRRGVDEPRPGQARVGPAAFVAPLAVWFALGAARTALTGHFLSPVLSDALAPDGERLAAGARQVADFFLRSGAMTLTVVPVAAALVGALSPRGRRALAVGLAWCAWVAWMGGHRLPMWQVLTPAVPFLAVAIQESLTALVDRSSVLVQRTAWTLFLVGLAASLLVSRRPADIGPLPLERLQSAWLADPRVERLFGSGPGRPGLVRRIDDDERRRCAAIFVRESLDPNARVATLWPGALGYLSGSRVVDLSGRATPGPDGRVRSDFGPLLVDLVEALAAEPDFVLPPVEVVESESAPEEVARAWLERFDTVGATPERVAALAAVLARYELVSVPIPIHSSEPRISSPTPYGLLRHERLGAPTELRVVVRDDRLLVLARHEGHQQVVDLVVERVGRDGTRRRLRPAGDFVDDPRVHARSRILLHSSGRRWIRLVDAPFERDAELDHLSATLVPPGSFDLTGERVARVEALWPTRE